MIRHKMDLNISVQWSGHAWLMWEGGDVEGRGEAVGDH